VNAQDVHVGWAPDSSGFAIVSREETGRGGCTVYDAHCEEVSTFLLPPFGDGSARSPPLPRRFVESVDAVLSPGARLVAFELTGVLHVYDLGVAAYVELPDHVHEREVIRAVGWLEDGRLAVYVSVPRSLGAVVSVHPAGSPFLTRELDGYWYTVRLVWATGESDRLRGPGSTDRFRGAAWVPASSVKGTVDEGGR
jgi:hypothetical protein